MRSQHMLGGAALWLGTTAVLPVPPVVALAGVPVAAYTALWPDIDSEQSTAARWLGPVTYRLALRIKRRYKHRGQVHSLFWGVPLVAVLATVTALVVGVAVVASTDVSVGVLWPLAGTVGAASLVGAASHPLLDFPTYGCGACATGRGICKGHPNPGSAMLWPLIRGRVGVAWILVGGRVERQVARPVLLGLAGVAAVFTVLGW